MKKKKKVRGSTQTDNQEDASSLAGIDARASDVDV